MRRLVFEESSDEKTAQSDRQNTFLLKKIIQKPSLNKYSSPSKLLCKKPLHLTQSKSFTPNPQTKYGFSPLDLKIRSYTTLDRNPLNQGFFNNCEEELLEDSYCCEKLKKPYNLITKEKLAEMIRDKNEEIVIIDCRYCFEYEGKIFFNKGNSLKKSFIGGHIKNAININNPLKMLEFFFLKNEMKIAETSEFSLENPDLARKTLTLEENFRSPTKEIIEKLSEFDFSSRKKVLSSKKIIFHCEFSQCRGPKLYNLLRNFDREINFKEYPKLTFPDICLLDGGYSQFQQFPVNNHNISIILFSIYH